MLKEDYKPSQLPKQKSYLESESQAGEVREVIVSG